MTPRETWMAIEAAIWREERRQKQDLMQAWETASLIRAKHMPSLKQLLAAKPAKKLAGKELEIRRREFKEMTANVDLKALAKKRKKK